jgi:hypothetical protein
MRRFSAYPAYRGRFRGTRRAPYSGIPRADSGDSCGCALAAKFLAIGLIVSVTWYALPGNRYGLPIDSVSLRILGWSFLAACVGKAVGILRFAMRQRKLRLKTIR